MFFYFSTILEYQVMFSILILYMFGSPSPRGDYFLVSFSPGPRATVPGLYAG